MSAPLSSEPAATFDWTGYVPAYPCGCRTRTVPVIDGEADVELVNTCTDPAWE